MSSSSVTTSDGTVIVSRDDDDDVPTPPAPPAPGTPATLHRDHGVTIGIDSDKPLDHPSFVAGLLLGMLLLLIVQAALRWQARRAVRGEARAAAIGPQRDDTAAHIAALARRTAALETIVTDPAQRTARDIEALR